MATVINDPGLNYGIGQSFGNLLGGLGVGYLEHNKRGQEKKSMLDYLQQTGVAPEAANAFVNTPPQFQEQAFKDLQRQRSGAHFAELLGGQPQPMGMQGMQPRQSQQAQQEQTQPLKGQQLVESLREQKRQALIKGKQVYGMNDKELEIIQNEWESRIKDAKHAEEQGHKETREDQKVIDKETLPTYEKIRDEYQVGKENKKTLGRMKQLVEKGSLPTSGFYNLFNKMAEASPTVGGAAGAIAGNMLGGPVGAAIGGVAGAASSPIGEALKSVQRGIFSTDTEEFEKLTASFIRSAKDIFGSRVTDADLAAFMKMVPSLSQTDNGKLAVISNMENFINAGEAKYKAMKKIIKENGGRRPANFDELIDEEANKELDKLAKEFVKGPAKEIKKVVKSAESYRPAALLGNTPPSILSEQLRPKNLLSNLLR